MMRREMDIHALEVGDEVKRSSQKVNDVTGNEVARKCAPLRYQMTPSTAPIRQSRFPPPTVCNNNQLSIVVD